MHAALEHAEKLAEDRKAALDAYEGGLLGEDPGQ